MECSLKRRVPYFVRGRNAVIKEGIWFEVDNLSNLITFFCVDNESLMTPFFLFTFDRIRLLLKDVVLCGSCGILEQIMLHSLNKTVPCVLS